VQRGPPPPRPDGDGTRLAPDRSGHGVRSGVPARQRARGAIMRDLTMRPFGPLRARSPPAGDRARAAVGLPIGAQDGNGPCNHRSSDCQQNPSHRNLPISASPCPKHRDGRRRHYNAPPPEVAERCAAHPSSRRSLLAAGRRPKHAVACRPKGESE
jgi:hypothetical protein